MAGFRTTAAAALVGWTLTLAMTGCGQDTAQQEELRAENARLLAEKDRLSTELGAARAREQESGSGLSGLHDQLSRATAALGDLGQQLETAKLAATAAKARYDEAAAKLGEAEDRIADLQNALNQTAREAALTAERYHHEAEALRAEIAELRTQLAAAVKALQDSGGLRNLLPPR